MFRSLIARICRWVHRISGRYCTLDMDKNARGLAKCIMPDPLTKEEKDEGRLEELLRGVDDDKKDMILEHFKRLSGEIDPLDGEEEIPNGSIKKTGIDISVEDVVSRFEQRDNDNDIVRAKNAMNGLSDWPITDNKNTKGKD